MEKYQIRTIAVFCGSSTGNDRIIMEDCLNLAASLCSHSIRLVYGGGNIGLMGMPADEVLRLGGEVIGVIPEKLLQIEVAHGGLTEMHIVKGMHERKALMASLADAFIVLPGGIGTMEEFFEIYTWWQLGYHSKPVAICNTNGFYDILLSFLQMMVNEGFVKKNQIDSLIIENNSIDIVNRIVKSVPVSDRTDLRAT